MNIDFSNFRKIEDGDKHAVLEHPSGHKLKIAKKGLSEQLRKQLDALPTNLAKGGYAKFAQKYDPNMGSKASKPSKSSTTMPGNQAAASKAFTEPDDMGTNIPKASLQQAMTDHQYPDVVINSLNKKAPPYGSLSSEPKQHYPPCINPSCKSFGKSHPNCRCYGGNPEGKESHLFAKGGEVEKEYYCDANRTHRKGCEYYADGGGVQTQTSQQPDPADIPVNDANAQSQASPMSAQPDMSSQSDANQEVPQSDMQNQSQTTPTDQGQQTEPDQQASQPMTPDQNPATADPYQQYQKNMLDTNQLMHNEANKFFSDVDQGHVQPKTMGQLFHDKSLPGKIGTLFGLIVAGGGAGLTHQDNAVLTTMQKEINNDLQAQEQNQKNRNNIMQINGQNLMQLANSGKIGADTRQMQIAMSKAQANYYLYNQLAQQAGNLSNPQQAQKAQQTLALMRTAMQNDNASAFAQAAGANALGQMLRGGGNTAAMKTGLYGPEITEYGQDVESKKVPGYGIAALPVPKDARDTLTSLDRFDASLGHLQNLMKAHTGTTDWTKYPEADTAAREAQQAYTTVRGAVPSYAGDAQLNKIITGGKNPLSILSYLQGNPGRIDEIKKANAIQRNSITNQYQLPIKKSAPKQKTQGPSGEEQQSTTSKSGKSIVYKNGKAYYQ